jgi:hypothetical protein
MAPEQQESADAATWAATHPFAAAHGGMEPFGRSLSGLNHSDDRAGESGVRALRERAPWLRPDLMPPRGAY